jgi:hypothetical protein
MKYWPNIPIVASVIFVQIAVDHFSALYIIIVRITIA